MIPQKRNLASLRVHRLLEHSPMLCDGHPDCLSIRASLETDGQTAPVLVNERDEILDGRHRVREMEKLGWTECEVSVRPDEDAAYIILSSLTARRHITKGLIAYTIAPVIEINFGDGKSKRSKNLIPNARDKKRENPNVYSNHNNCGSSNSDGIDAFVEALGISSSTWLSAKNLRKLFHDKPGLKKRFEPRMFLPEDHPDFLSLSGCAHAVYGAHNYDSDNPPDLQKKRNEHARLVSKWLEKADKQLEMWEMFSAAERNETAEAITTRVCTWPVDVQRAIWLELKKNPPKAEG